MADTFLIEHDLLIPELHRLRPGESLVYYQGQIFNLSTKDEEKNKVSLIISQAYLTGNFNLFQKVLPEFDGPYPLYSYTIQRRFEKDTTNVVWLRTRNSEVVNDRRSLQQKKGYS